MSDPSSVALTDEEIIGIRDAHLPSQGESFDCLAFGRAIAGAAAMRAALKDAPDARRYRFLRSPLAGEAGPVQLELARELAVKLCREEKMDHEVDAAMRLLHWPIAMSAPAPKGER